MPTLAPLQFSSADGTLAGAINGLNLAFSFVPRPATLLYNPAGIAGTLLFRNGLLVNEYDDYATGYSPGRAVGYFTAPSTTVADTFTARSFGSLVPSKLRLSHGGITAELTSLWLSPLSPQFAVSRDMALFRNGQLLTPGDDYSVSGVFIVMAPDQLTLPGDEVVAVIGLGGTACSTFAGTITGVINGTNAVFTLPSAEPLPMLFRNGQLLTAGLDYTQSGATVTLLGDQIPIITDVLTARVFPTSGPGQLTSFDGSLYYATPDKSMLFRNGILMTQPGDGAVTGDAVALAGSQAPQTPPDDTLTVESWVPNILDADAPAFNLSRQMPVIGAIDGVNNVFTLATTALATQVMFFWNGDYLTEGVDYTFTCSQEDSSGAWQTVIALIAPPFPSADDILTAEVYFA